MFPKGEYQKKSTNYLLERALTKPSDHIPEIILEKVSFYRNHYEMLLTIKIDKIYENQKILNIDLGSIYNIAPRYFPFNSTDSVWTKIPAFPILLENFFEDCIKCGGGIINEQADNERTMGSCVFRFLSVLPYQTKSIMFKGVGSPINHVEINIKPYLKRLAAEWREKSAYRGSEWKFWRPNTIQ